MAIIGHMNKIWFFRKVCLFGGYSTSGLKGSDVLLCPVNLFIFSSLCCLFISIFFLNSMLISFVKDKDVPLWWGYLIAASMFLCAVLQTIILHHHFQYCFVTGMRLRTGIIGMVYRKVRASMYPNISGEVSDSLEPRDLWVVFSFKTRMSNTRTVGCRSNIYLCVYIRSRRV